VGLNKLIKPPKLTEAGLARELGVSRQAVHDLVSRGILTKDKDGMIDVEMAQIALLNRVRPSGKTTQAILNDTQPNAAQQPPQPLIQPLVQPDENSEITSYHIARTLREAAEAQISRHKLAEMRGESVNKSEIEAAIFGISRAIRDGLTNCSSRIAADVAMLTTADTCKTVIDREHRTLMNNMVQQFKVKMNIEEVE
jgi:hypothetical protein